MAISFKADNPWGVVKSLALSGSILAALAVSGCLVVMAADETNRTLHLRFLEPQAATYAVDRAPKESLLSARGRIDEVRARRMPGPPEHIVLRDKVVLGLADGVRIDTVLADSPLTVSRTVGPNLFVLQAPDAMTAALEADRLARVQGVAISHPVRKRPAKLHWRYAPAPNDTYFPRQWHLENRDSATGVPLGFDLGIRSAWADNLGEGVTIAIVDEGVATSHPDLAGNMPGTYDHNFVTGSSSGTPMRLQGSHGTAVAGLVAAVGNNSRGVIGVAPKASMASWVVFDASEYMVDEETMMDALQYCSNVVSIQNHSWGNASVGQLAFGALEDQAIENAVTKGRNGLGVIMVRSAGNDWQSGNDVNDDGYGQDPRAIAVGAIRATGRAASYTTPGAPVLVAAFSGDQDVATPSGGTTNYIQLCTTDLQGALGRNTDPVTGDYGFDSTGFGGTSGSAPQISGLCALMLNANPNLTWRDVQQILVLSARQLDASDPDTKINGAGLPVNHRVGFGVPDAGQAVRLARW
ncbi:MAG TPA: S8 family serine peptidase, partial [Verrucomicrobiota bacterium]|nr:S8 family serine peptidase [Verrucomicrobiota bacterium]